MLLDGGQCETAPLIVNNSSNNGNNSIIIIITVMIFVIVLGMPGRYVYTRIHQM